MHPLIEFLQSATNVWEKGGSLMPIIGLLSIYTYCLAFDLWFRLRTVIPKDLKAFPRERWGAFEGGGRVDRILRHCLGNHRDPKETRRRFAQIRIADSSYLRRRIRFLLVLAIAISTLHVQRINLVKNESKSNSNSNSNEYRVCFHS